MAFSGTVSQTVFNTRRVIDHAMRRCKLPAQVITSEYIDIANDQLFLLLANWANLGVPLWCIEREIYPLYDGNASITTSDGTVDVLNANLRTLQSVTGTDTDTSTTHSVEFADETVVSAVGIFWSAASAPIALERSDDGAVWVTVQTETPDAGDGEWTWYDLDTFIASSFFRVRATSGTLDFDTIYLGNTPTEIPLARMNRDDYTTLPNKSFLSNRPLQYWFDRQVNNPIMRLWPVPNSDAETSQIIVWRQRYIMDVGTMTQEIEVPQRWYEALVASLAAKMAAEIVEVSAELLPTLDAMAQRAFNVARAEERDNSPIMISPNIGMYTR